jgi:hypothetical protein
MSEGCSSTLAGIVSYASLRRPTVTQELQTRVPRLLQLGRKLQHRLSDVDKLLYLQHLWGFMAAMDWRQPAYSFALCSKGCYCCENQPKTGQAKCEQ